MSGKSISSNILNFILKKLFAVTENLDKNLGDVSKILIIRQHNQLGDMLAGVSLFKAIKEKYPQCHLTLLSSVDNYYGVVKNKLIDELIVFDKSKMFNPIEFIRFFKKLREDYDLVVVPVTVSISFTSNLIAGISRSKTRIGPKSLDGKPNDSAYFFDRRVDIDWRKHPDSNVSEHILEIVKPFGIDTKDLSSEISFDESDNIVAKKFISEIQKDSGSLVIGLHVGAGKSANRWSLNKYIELIQKLHSNYNCVFYLTGSDSDSEELNYVVSNIKVKLHKYLNKQIPQVAALILNSDLFITNDTGIMHVAGTTTTSQVSLFGPTNPFNWAPCGKNKIFLRKSDLIDDIEVEEVFDVCKILLQNK